MAIKLLKFCLYRAARLTQFCVTHFSAFLLNITTVLMMCLLIFVLWLGSSGQGELFIVKQLEWQAARYGYDIAIKDVKRETISHWKVDEIHIGNNKGFDVKLRNLALEFDIEKAFNKILDARFHAAEVFIKDQRITAVVLTLEANLKDTVSGRFETRALLDHYDLLAQADFEQNENILLLKNILVKAPQAQAKGSISLENGLAVGQLEGGLKTLAPYQKLVGSAHVLNPTSIMIKLDNKDSEQRFAIYATSDGYQNRDLGLSFQNVKAEAEILGETTQLKSLTMQSKDGGMLFASGFLAPIAGGGIDVDLNFKANRYVFKYNNIATGIFNSDLKFQNQDEGYLLSGLIQSEEVSVALPDRFGPSIQELNLVRTKKEKQEPDITDVIILDLDLKLPEKVFVRGLGLDAEFGGELTVLGMASEPSFQGNIDLIRGRFSEFGKNFELKKANMNFSGSIPPSPRLDIVAETRTEEGTAQILIKGNAQEPIIDFASDPAKPKDEVLALILFGEDINNLSPFQLVQLTQTLQRFSGAGGKAGQTVSHFDPIGSVREATGLDDLRVDGDSESGATVGAGKYLADGVYLELEAGSEKDSGSATVEIELSPNVTLESEVGQNAQGGAGLFYKWDY
ncbi:MAG: hypothetical protein GC137_03925 [Alphaproteobacteria bacterium]|nr:hypothetical protein [Alphaproteobacteria bacterium]